MDHPWKPISDIHAEAIEYMERRKDGTIKSVKTPWASFNNAGVDGLEYGSIVTIAGRPGSGKTAIVKEFTTNIKKFNPHEDIAVLDFQFEMSSRTTGVREFSSVIKKSYKELLSVGKPLPQAEIDYLKDYSNRNKNKEIYQIDKPMTVTQMEEAIIAFIKMVNKPVIVTIDHSILIKRSASEKDVFDTLYSLGEMLTRIKKVWDIIFIVLTQMNRTIEDQTRKIPGTAGNYPTSADIFGADSLLMHSDLLVVINKPFNYNLELYGPEQYEVTENLLALHFLKTRNGDNKLCFFEARFEHMSILEIPTPLTRKMTSRRTNFNTRTV